MEGRLLRVERVAAASKHAFAGVFREHTKGAAATPVLNAFAVVSYDPRDKAFQFRAYTANGQALTADARLRAFMRHEAELAAKADPNLTDNLGQTALFPLVTARDVPNDIAIPLVESLLKAGAKPDPVEKDGSTPLLNATVYWNPPAVKTLLRAGADANRIYARGTLLDINDQDAANLGNQFNNLSSSLAAAKGEEAQQLHKVIPMVEDKLRRCQEIGRMLREFGLREIEALASGESSQGAAHQVDAASGANGLRNLLVSTDPANPTPYAPLGLQPDAVALDLSLHVAALAVEIPPAIHVLDLGGVTYDEVNLHCQASGAPITRPGRGAGSRRRHRVLADSPSGRVAARRSSGVIRASPVPRADRDEARPTGCVSRTRSNWALPADYRAEQLAGRNRRLLPCWPHTDRP